MSNFTLNLLACKWVFRLNNANVKGIVFTLFFTSILFFGEVSAQMRPVSFPTQLQEIPSLRSRSHCVFKLNSTTNQAVISAGSVNYWENNQWNLIDMEIYNSTAIAGHPFANIDNSFKSYYPATPALPVHTVINNTTVLEWGAPQLSWRTFGMLPGLNQMGYSYVGNQPASNSAGAITANEVLYSNIYSNTDARFTQFADGRHLDYILKSASAISIAQYAATEVAFSEKVILPLGWKWSISPNQTDIYVYDATGTIRMNYTTPYIYEQNFAGADVETGATATSGSISGKYDVEQNGNEITIYTLVDYAWLTDASRNYPVVVDPTTIINPATVNSYTGWTDGSTLNNITGGNIQVTTLTPARGWARFDLSVLGPLASVTASTLSLTNNGSVTSGAINNVKGMTVNPLTGTAAALFADIGATGVGTIYSSQTWAGTGTINLALNATANTAIFAASSGAGFISMGLARGSTNTYLFRGWAGPNPPELSVTFTSAVAADLALIAPAQPVSPVCSGLQNVNVTLQNSGSSTWDFATNPATVTCSVTGPNPTTFPAQTISSGTLASLASQVVTFASGTYDMSLSGTYTFTYAFNPVPTGDGNVNNNTLVSVVTKTISVTSSASPVSLCSNGTSQISTTVTGNSVGLSISSTSINRIAVPPGAISPTSGDDAVSSAIALPFTFNFYGVAQTQLFVYTNGFVQFGTSSGSTTTYGATIPTAGAPDNIIAICWEDLNPAAGQITYFTTGVAPNRIFCVDFDNVNYFSATPGVTSQLQLHENNGNNFFQIHVTNNTQSGNFTVLGSENSTGTVGNVPSGRNFGAWLPQPTLNEAWLFTPALPPTFSWSPSTGLSSTSITNPIIDASFLPIGNTTYTITVNDPTTGCVSTQTVTVTNLGAGNPAPTTTSFSSCPNDSAHLVATGLATLNWYDAQFGGNLKHIGTNWDSVWVTTTTYWVSSDNGTCPSQRTPVTVTITPVIPVAASANRSVICVGDTTLLSASSGTTLTYSQVFLNGASTVAQCQAWDAFCASLVPAPYSSVQMFGDNNPVAVTGRTVTNPATAQAIAAAMNTRSAASFPAADGTNTWLVSLACGSGCGATPATVELSSDGTACSCPSPGWSFRPNLVGSNSGGLNTATCGGPTQTMNLRFSSAVPLTTYSWAPALGLSCTTCANPIANPLVTTTYTITTQDPNNGCTVTASVTVTVNPLPLDPTFVSNSTQCGPAIPVGACVSSNNGAGFTLKWYDGPHPGAGVLKQTGGTCFASSISSTTTWYVVDSNNATGCISSAINVVSTVNVADPISLISSPVNPPASCPTSPVTLTASSTAPYAYTWTPAANLNISTGSTVISTAALTETYTVSGFDGASGCVNNASITILRNTLIPVTAASTKANICAGDTTLLSATSGSEVMYSETFIGGASTIAQCQSWDTFLAGLNPASYTSVKMFGDGGGGNPIAVTGRTVTNVATTQAIATALKNRTAATFPAADGTNTWIVGLACGSGCGATPATVELSADGTTCSCVTPGWSFRPNLTAFNSGGINTATCGGPTQTMNLKFSSLIPLTSYSWAPALGLSCTTCANPIASPSVTTTYTVTTFDPNNGCTITATVTINVNSLPTAPTASIITTPCGNGTATVSALGSGGTLIWWNASTFGTQLGTGSPFNILVTGDTTIFVSETTLAPPGCASLRTPLFIDISDPDTITATVSQSLICGGTPGATQVTLTATNISVPQLNTFVYTWTQSSTNGGLNSFTGASVTANPLATTTYTVTAFDPGTNCTRIKTLTVGVGAIPTVAPTGFVVIDACDSANIQLNANAVSSNFISVNANIGTGTVQNSPTAEPAPYGNFWGSNRTQMLIQASELSAAGLVNGSSLSQIKFDVVNTNGTAALQAFTISLGLTNATALTSGVPLATPFNVFGPVVYTPTNGINTHTFSSPVIWDGVSSIVVNTCFFNTSFTSNCSFNQTTTTFISTMNVRADGASQCSNPPGTTFFQRPNIVFTATAGTTVSVSWSPSAGLNSSTIQNPTAKIGGTTTYTVTATENGSGCSATASVTVNFTPTAIPPAPTATGATICGPGIVNLSVTTTDAINNITIWTDTIGGQIKNFGTTYNPYVTQSGSYYVHEIPPYTSPSLGNNIGASAGFFPDGASFMNFTVTAPGGIIINTVDVSTNVPATSPLVIALVSSTGQIVSVLDTIFINGGTTALQTISLNLYVPQGVWRLQPILNPNLNVSNTSTLPATIPGQITVSCFGNVSNACFPINFNGLFYNWVVNKACISPAAIVNYVVNTPPAIGIASSNGMSFCDSVNTVLTAVDSTSSGYDTFSWSPATGLSATTGASVTVSALFATTTYTLNASNSLSGCSAILTKTLTLNPAPTLSLSYRDTTICPLAVPVLPFNATAAKSSVVPIGNRFSPNFVNGQLYGGNTTQYSQMIFTAAELNAAGLVGPTNISSIAYFVSSKLTTTTYTVDIKMRADGGIPTDFPSTAHINTGLTTVYTNPAITSALGWNTYPITPFFWDGVSNLLVSQCFTHNIPGFFDIVPTSPTGGIRFSGLNAAACGAATGAFIPVPNQNDRPNVRFTGGNVLFSWSPALGLSGTTIEDPTVTAALIGNNDTTITYKLTVTDPLSGCAKTDSIRVTLSRVPLNPIVKIFGDSVLCFSGMVKAYVSGTTGDFQWQSSTDGINFTDMMGQTNDTLIQTISTTRYYRVDVSCGVDSINSRILTFIVNRPAIDSTKNDTICGIGTVTLQAFGSNGTTLNWYADSTGGTSIGTGGSFTTPVISSTTTYYVQAAAAGSTTTPINAPVGVASGTTQAGMPFRGGNGTAMRTQYLYTAAELNAAGFTGGNWNQVRWTFTTAIGGSTLMGNFTIRVGGTAATSLTGTFLTDPSTVVFGPVAFTPPILIGDVIFPFSTPFVWDGVSNVYIEICHDNPVPGVGSGLMASNTTSFTSVQFVGNVCGTPSGASTQTARPIINISGTTVTGCFSARVPVVAVSTPAPAVNIVQPSTTICQLTCTNLNVDAPSTASYQVFNWSPAAGLSATTGSSVQACPLLTTTYIVTGFDTISGLACSNTDTVVITVTPAPTLSITTTGNPSCGTDSSQITATAIPFIVPSAAYVLTPSSPTMLTPTGTVTVLATGGVAVTPQSIASLDDGTWDNIALPSGFAFNYFGTTPTTFSVSTNGFMTFGPSGGAFCCSGQIIPSAFNPNSYLAFAHEDWLLSASGTVDFFTNGVAPFRKFVVRFTAVPRFGGTGAPSTGEIVLNETLNTIEYHVASVTTASFDNTTMGIEDPTGTLATVVLGRNSNSPWTATNEGWTFSPPIASGITYAWSPAAGLSSTSISNPKAQPNGTTVYTLTVTETGTGCSRTSSVTIINSPLPEPTIAPGDSLGCAGTFSDYWLYAVDTGAYAGGYPPGTLFDWSINLGGPVADLDSILLDLNNLGNITLTVTLPASLGNNCSGTSSINVNFSEPVQTAYMSQDSVSCTPNNDGVAYVQHVDANGPIRYVWVDALGDTVRDITNNYNYAGLFDADLDGFPDDRDGNTVIDALDNYNIFKDSLQNLMVGTFTVYITTNAGDPYPTPQCVSSGTIIIGRTPCAPPQLLDPCVCVDNADVNRRAPYTDGQFMETVSLLGGQSPWAIVSLTSGLGKPISNIAAIEDCIDNTTQTTPVTDADIIVVTPNDSSYINFYLFDGDTYTLVVEDASGAQLTISGGGCNYPEAPINDTTITVCADNFGLNIQDAAFPGGVDPSIVLSWYDDSLCTGSPLMYGDLSNVPANYPDLTNSSNPGPGGNIGYTVYNFYVASDSVADASCEGKRAMVTILSNEVVATLDSTVNVNCNGEASGAIYITMTNGTAPFTYAWSDGSTTEDLTNLVAYTYDLVVTDSLGCTYQMSFDITENPPYTIGKNIINNQCHGDSTGQIVLFISGAVPFTNGAPYTYLWSNGQTTNIANYLFAGTYTVTVTDSVGCDTILTFQIFEPTLLDQTHTIVQPLCNGGTGDITVNAFGGTPWTGLGVHPIGYEFSLDGGPSQTSGIFTGIAGGSHTIAITDSNSCITYLIFNINEPAAMVCGGAVSNVMCNGGNNGSITANITGGTGNYSYLWNNNSTNQTISGLTSGAYTVTVTDGNGCTIECMYTVTEPAAITFSATACANVSCFGGNDGKACVTNVLGGTPPYNYQWNTLPAQTTAQATGLTAGTWTVTITDAMGCMVMGDVVITQPAAALSITGTATNTTCNGGNNGSINISVSGGTLTYTLLWNNGNTTTSNSGLTAGTYTVTVTDAKNCTATASYTVGQPTAIAISLVSTNVSCNGGGNGSITASASGGSGTYTYAWSNGASTSSISGLAAGIYTITVTDGSGCSLSSSATITSPSALGCICNSNVTNVSCFGGSNGSVSALPLGGTAPYSYLWNNGSSTQSISGLVAGTYTVTITDANGCTKVGTATVTQPSQLFVFVAGQNLTCAGNNTGAATATPSGGVAPYTYLWTPTGQTTPTATGLAAGNYSVKVTDANGCTATAQVTITQPPSMTLTSKRTNVSCFGGFNGTFTVVANGGSPAYSYLWSNGKTTKFIIGLGAGTYTVTVTDAAGCTKTLSGIITQPPAMVALYTVTNVNCNGGTTGAIDLTVTGGTSPYTYVWSNGALTQDITNIAAGIYAVTVKDKKGCIINATVVVTQPSPISLSMTPKSPKCFGGNNGQATVTASGGTVPYSYLWSNGNTTSTATGLVAGTYTVTVTDSKACSATMSVTISQPTLLTCTASVIQGIACNNGTGKIGVTAAGGTPGYTYTWNTNPIATTAIVNNLVAGTYTVIVKDKNNCTTMCSVTLTQPLAIICAPLTSTPVSCSGSANGTATISGIAGGTAPYTLLWNSSTAQTTPTATGLSAGTYTVTVTDANGCTKSASVIVGSPTPLLATYSNTSPGCNGGTGTISVIASGGTAPYGYTLNPGAINSTNGFFGGLSAGTYSVTVTDANLCTTSVSNIIITSGNTITANQLSTTNVNCNGGNNGTASISGISGGLAPYTIMWSTIPAQGTLTATGLTAGTYTVTVTDANGCTYTASANITEPSTPVMATINSQINIDCNGGGLGEATVLASGGSSTNSYLDNNFAAAFPSGLVLGGTGGCGTPYTLTFTSPAAIRAFIPNALGVALPLAMDMTNPTNGSYINSLAGALVATTLNVKFDLFDPNFAPTSTVHLEDLIYGSAPFAGMTVQQIVNESNNMLAGCGSIYTPNQLRTVLQQINHSWENGVPGNGFLSCPVGPGCNTFYSLTQEGWDATGGYTYLWSNGQTTSTATGLTAGTYVVTVTDANGCTAVTQVTITQPGSLTISAAAINALCNGGANGMVLASAQLGTPPYSFMISPMAGTQTNPTADSALFTGLAAGTYTVIVTDAGDCTAETDVTVNEPSAIASNTTHVNVSCNGGSNGVATVYAIGGTPGYTYQWSNGTSVVSTNQQATGLPAGTYTVTVTDANGCINTGSTTIAQPAVLSITPTQVDVSCNGQGTGSATAAVSGGTAPYNYLWNNGQQSSTATGLMAGTYTVTVTDYKGCTKTQSYSLTAGVNIVVNPTQTPILCNGGTSVLTVSPTGGTGTYTYSWSQAPGNTTNTAIVNAGVYYVIVTDGAGCSITYCFVVAQPNPVACAISSTGVTCNGSANGSATANAIGGTPPYSYLWNDASSQSTQTAIGLSAGAYTVLVTDSNGCTSQCSITITEPQALSVGTSNTNVSCQNPTGTAVAIVGGGTAPYTYLWSNGASTSAITGLLPGTYTVTVNDANGCGPVTAQATILAPVAVTCSTTSTMTSCNGYHNGTATVTPGGGNGVYSVIWNTTPAQTTLTATGMSAGSYTVVVMDGLGCSSTCNVVVQEPAPLVYSYNINNTCSGSNGGTSTINAMGGTMYTNGNPYTYLWNNGQTTQTATGLGSGTYYVTVTDSLGCAIQAVIIMPQSQAMTCNTFCTPTACGQATGTATVNVFGGTMPYTYQWSNGNTNAINTGLAAGTYTVLVTDAQGCTTTCIANVGQPANIQFTLAVVNPPCNAGTGSVTIANLNGGMAPYTYLWSDGSTLLSITGVAGTYTVTVTDTNSCSVTMTASIVAPPALAVTTSGVNVSCNGYTNGSASVSVAGGTAPYNYAWNTGGSLSYINNVAAGTYTVTVTDANGCTINGSVLITEPLKLDTISTSSIASTCGLCNGSGTVVITGGTTPYSYLWSNGATTDNATGLCAGNNFVTVTDAKGCVLSVCVKVIDTGSFTAALTSPTYAGGYNIRCNGGLDGAVNLTVNPIGTYTYNWSNGATDEDLFGVGAGIYSVTVSNGTCTQTLTITLTQAPLLTASATGTNVNCSGTGSGTATALASGGVMPYTYSWSNGQTSQTATGLMAGTYTVTIGDANGCTAIATYTVTGFVNGLSITETHVNPTCYGGTNGSINITVAGGTTPYTYIWTGGATTEDRTNIGAGSHTVTVTDANGCTITLCVVVTQPNAIVISMSTTNASCNGGNNGSAAAAVSGGSSPYSYLWNTGANTASINGLAAGTYTVTVTDANGCTLSANKAVGAPVSMSVIVDSVKNVTANGGNNGAAYISLSGGAAPFVYSWNTIPVKTTQDVTGLTAGTYQVTVTDAAGCVANATVTITQPNYICSNGTPFHTETPAAWIVAANGSNIGTYLSLHFPNAFPGSLVVGGGCLGSKTLTLTNATAVRSFLTGQPLSGGANLLSSNLNNPTSGTFSSALAANIVALKLSVVFDAYDGNFAPVPTVWLANLIYNNPAGPVALNGLTVNQVLFEAEKKLGGCSSSLTGAQLTTALNNINLSYLGGVAGASSTMLTCPAPPKLGDVVTTIGNIVAYPNPTEGQLNIRFVIEQDSKVTIRLFDAIGRLAFNTTEAAFEGVNERSYNVSDLSKGVYMLNVQVNGMTETIRVVIK